MYVETFLWLQEHPRPEGWNTTRNAVIESHLIHARVLIHFVQRDRKNSHNKESKKNEQRCTDVFAVDYFDEIQDFLPLPNEFLATMAHDKIGGQLVHLTTNAQLLKSEQEWRIYEIASNLIPTLQNFAGFVSEKRFPKVAECGELLSRLSLWLSFNSDKSSPVYPST
jgi:hypothetical protein